MSLGRLRIMNWKSCIKMVNAGKFKSAPRRGCRGLGKLSDLDVARSRPPAENILCRF
jgi:hypothetical protein